MNLAFLDDQVESLDCLYFAFVHIFCDSAGPFIICTYSIFTSKGLLTNLIIIWQFEAAMSRRKPEDVRPEQDEAEEVREEVEHEDLSPIENSEQEGEDLIEDAERDYQPIAELDRYQPEGIDDEEIVEDPEARRKAEKALQKRDIERVAQSVDDYLDSDLDESESPGKRKLIIFEDEDQEVDQRRFLDAEEVKGKLPQWIKQDQTIKYIRAKFTKFLNHFKGDTEFPIYGTKIREMCISNLQSIEISYSHLKQALPTIAMWVGLEPALILPQLNSIAYSIACKYYASYKAIFPEVFIKIKELPILDLIRDLRHVHLGKLIKVKGVVTIRSEIFNQLKKIIYKCLKCGFLKGPFYINNINDIRLGSCSSCQSTGPFPIDKQKTIYRNYQKLILQESPSQVLPGRIPRSKEIILFGDNIDKARPGDYIEVTGIYMNRYECYLNVRQGFPLFSTLIQANCITKLLDSDGLVLGEGQEQKILKFSKTQNLDEIIYNSIAPSIYGHTNIKRAITLAMFSGVQRVVEGTHRIRGDINVLLLGDPGTAKSQFLKSIQKSFYRCIYTTGKGASAVGLTASVKRDHATNEWKLEAGALVLADKGICLIDQFDKMNEHDRTSIHEAMEQQSISISKAGIVTTLRARCSVIAAANPLNGKYNSTLAFSQNLDLSDPILSRFDVLAVVRDETNSQIDYHLSTFVINSHMKNHPYKNQFVTEQNYLTQTTDDQPRVDALFLQQYIKYARERCRPQLSEKNRGLIQQFYVKLREEAKFSGGMHIAVRHIESIIRLSVAHAKIYLRSQVSKQDVEVGIRCMLESFIQTQKHSVAKQIIKKFGAYLSQN